MRRLLGMLLFVTLATSACSDDDENGTGVDATITGTYTLQSFNGNAPPVVVMEGGGAKLEIMSATLTINQNGTFSETDQFRVTQGTTVFTDQETFNGTWARSGNNVTLTAVHEGQTEALSAVWNGSNQLTFSAEGDTYIFKK